jgi:hypothetical protein
MKLLLALIAQSHKDAHHGLLFFFFFFFFFWWLGQPAPRDSAYDRAVTV